MFAPEAITDGASTAAPPVARHIVPKIDARAEARARLHEWDREATQRLAPHVLHVTRGLLAMQQRFGAWFMPTAAMLDAVDGTAPGLSDVLPLHPAGSASLCFGACGQGHLIGQLRTIIEVLHDGRGLPAKWHVAVSSGDPAFDIKAEAAIGDAVSWARPSVLTAGDTPTWSRWSFSALIYRWHRGELLLDPQFTPPGEKLDRQSNWVADTRLVREVRLVAVRYQDDAATTGGGQPTQTARLRDH